MATLREPRPPAHRALGSLTWREFLEERLEATVAPLAWLVALVVGAGLLVDVVLIGAGTAPRQIMHAVSIATMVIPPVLHLARRGGLVGIGARRFNGVVCFLVGVDVAVSLLFGGLASQFGYVSAAFFAFSMFLVDGFLWSLCAFPVCAAYLASRVYSGRLDAGTPAIVHSFFEGMDTGVGASLVLALVALRLRITELRSAHSRHQRAAAESRRHHALEHRLGLLDLAGELVRGNKTPLTLLIGKLDMIEWHATRSESGTRGAGPGGPVGHADDGTPHVSELIAQARRQVRRLAESEQALLGNIEAHEDRSATGTGTEAAAGGGRTAGFDALHPVSLADLMARIRTRTLETLPGAAPVPLRFSHEPGAREDAALLSLDADRVADALASLVANHVANGPEASAMCSWDVALERGQASLSLDFPPRVGEPSEGTNDDPLPTVTPTDFHASLADWVCRANGGRLSSRGSVSAPSYVFEFPLRGRGPLRD